MNYFWKLSISRFFNIFNNFKKFCRVWPIWMFFLKLWQVWAQTNVTIHDNLGQLWKVWLQDLWKYVMIVIIHCCLGRDLLWTWWHCRNSWQLLLRLLNTLYEHLKLICIFHNIYLFGALKGCKAFVLTSNCPRLLPSKLSLDKTSFPGNNNHPENIMMQIVQVYPFKTTFIC